MRECVLDCSCIGSPAELHSALREALGFPDWYGGNLDALYDCLTSIAAETKLTLLHFEELGAMQKGLRRVLQDAAAKNPLLHVTFSEGPPEWEQK